MIADDPRAPARRGQLATLLISEAHMLLDAGRGGDAIKALNEAVALGALVTEESTQPLWAETEGIALDRLADALRAQGDEAGALDAYRASLAAADALPPTLRNDPNARATAAANQEAIASILEARKDFAGALAAARAAIALRHGLADEAPADAPRRRAELIDDNAAGRLANLSGDVKASLAAFRDGLDVARALAARPDAGELARSDLALSLLLVGGVLSPSGDPRAPQRRSRKACRSLRRSSPRPPAIPNIGASPVCSLSTSATRGWRKPTTPTRSPPMSRRATPPLRSPPTPKMPKRRANSG